MLTPLQYVLALGGSCYADSESLRLLIHIATEDIGPAYGDDRNKAIALLTLHLSTLSKRGSTGAPGAVVSESEGDLSVSYAQPSSGQTGSVDLNSTQWGQMLLRLQSSTIVSFTNRRVSCLE